MSEDARKILRIPWLQVAAAAIAVIGGYWCGSAERNETIGESGHKVTMRGHQPRDIVAHRPQLTPQELVRQSMRGGLDERQLWRQVRYFTELEVKAAIGELGDATPHFMATPNILEMLFYRWGELDPVAANAAARLKFPKGFSMPRKAVIAAWIQQGGAVAAWNAVKDESEVWACTRSVPGEVADMLVASYSDRDDAAAFKEVLLLDDENCEIADSLCRARADKASGTPGSRAAFLAAAAIHPKPFVLGCAYEYLFRAWAEKDLEKARAGASSMPIPEEFRDAVKWEIERAREKKSQEENADSLSK